MHIDIIDPQASSDELFAKEGLEISNRFDGKYHGIILAVDHHDFKKYSASFLRSHLIENGKLFDLKNMFPIDEVDIRL